MNNVDFSILIFVIKALIPKTIKIFKILLPTTFPMVIPEFPFNPATNETAASGKLVPIAQIVNPITNWETWKILASEDAPSTNQSAPFTKTKKPAVNHQHSGTNPHRLQPQRRRYAGRNWHS